MRASWMVQATVNEPLDLLVAFVAHYLELGADLVHLCFDRPHPEAEALFRDNPKIRLTRCDVAYWAAVSPRGRPMNLPARQIANAKALYPHLEYDWLLTCDADEYLQCKTDVGAALAAVSPSVDYVRLKVAEKVLPPDANPQTIFEGLFRLPRDKGKTYAKEIYGPELGVLLERVVAGHDLGKSFVRRGRHMDMHIHAPRALPASPKDTSPPREPVGETLPDAYLAHYDALTPFHYLVKQLGKYVTNRKMAEAGQKRGLRHRSRELQVDLAASACADPNPVSKTEILHRLTPESLAGLKKYGLILDLDLAPDQIARKHFPDVPLDFTPEAFDESLRIKHAFTLEEMGIG